MVGTMETSAVAGLALILSNLALVPAIIYAAYKQYVTELVFLVLLFTSSTTYHICQADFGCVFTMRALQTTDHFMVYSTLVWITLFFLRLPLVTRICLLIIAQVPLLPALVDFLDNWWIAVALVGYLVLIGIISMVVMKRFPTTNLIDFYVAVLLLGVGFFLHVFAGTPGSENYGTLHTVWHVLAMLALFFVLLLHEPRSFIEKYVKNPDTFDPLSDE